MSVITLEVIDVDLQRLLEAHAAQMDEMLDAPEGSQERGCFLSRCEFIAAKIRRAFRAKDFGTSSNNVFTD